MSAAGTPALSRSAIAIPLLALLVLGVVWGKPVSTLLAVLVAAALCTAVLSAVHHAEMVAHRVGEPFGSLVLAVAVTIIEVALIVAMMLSGGAAASALPRDTVFAAVMIICNGMVGLCLLVGGIRHHALVFRIEGVSPAFAVLVSLTTMTLVLPTYTVSTPGPTFSPAQLVFAGVMSLVLYGVFLFVQTVRHREYFLPPADENMAHAPPPSNRTAWISAMLLLACLVAVVGLAKTLSPAIEAGVSAAGAPAAVVGVIIAMLVLAPETLAAVRSAAANRMQVSLNLALGSGLASIGLTIPAVVALSFVMDLPLSLGLAPKETVLLVVTFFVGGLTLGGGRATVLQGAVHLALFAAFLFLTVIP